MSTGWSMQASEEGERVLLPASAARALESVIEPDWTVDAACVSVDPELWFPEKGGRTSRAVLEICAACPVRASCLATAVVNVEDGIWGRRPSGTAQPGASTNLARRRPARRVGRAARPSRSAWHAPQGRSMTTGLVSAPVANADGDIELSPAAGREVFARINRPDYRRWATQVGGTGGCSHPVRLVGASSTIDSATGELLGSYESATEPDRVTYVRCGNRRADVCPSCSTEYAGDLWHQLSAGMVGGKGVPEDIRQHPLVFATLTAPSFGAVHSCVKAGRSARRCRPRSTRTLCPHGRPTWCMRTHTATEPEVGRPLCPDCYDYTGHVIWQWWAPELWRRFTITLRRQLAQHLGVSEKAARDLVRVQFAKVAEYQRRGVIHFHALIRLDGPPTDDNPWPAPQVNVTADELCDLVRSAASAVRYVSPEDGPRLPALELRFGAQVDARIVHDLADRDDPEDGDLHPETVAAYIAKYAKATAVEPSSGAQAHLRRVRYTVDRLGRTATREPRDGIDADALAPYGRLGRWADALGSVAGSARRPARSQSP